MGSGAGGDSRKEKAVGMDAAKQMGSPAGQFGKMSVYREGKRVLKDFR